MITHGVFMSVSEELLPEQEALVRKSRQISVDSACCAIDLIYETFSNYSFFQTWYANFQKYFLRSHKKLDTNADPFRL